jgi:hypothetical protein
MFEGYNYDLEGAKNVPSQELSDELFDRIKSLGRVSALELHCLSTSGTQTESFEAVNYALHHLEENGIIQTTSEPATEHSGVLIVYELADEA